jgi:putative NADH-flavin reductase
MNILILGANGKIGSLTVNRFLKNGDRVIAYVRRRDSVDTTDSNLEIVEGNLDNSVLIESLIKRTDAVVSTLGPHMDMSRKIKSTPISDAHETIIRLMKKNNKKRFITIGTTTIQSKTDIKHYSNTILPIIPKILFPTGYYEYRKIGQIISDSDIDWTVVRFLDPKGKHKSNSYNVTLEGRSNKTLISRENIADFIFKVTNQQLYIKQMPLIYR